jgi:hypothetical protein
MDAAATHNLPADPMTDLSHVLIRSYNGDQFDPFMVHGHPYVAERPDRIVRACFYYGVVMTPKLTAIYDNCDRGGMCDMTPDEIAVIWRTPALLEKLGTTFEALQNGTAVIDLDLRIPPDINVWEEIVKSDLAKATEEAKAAQQAA